MTNRVLIANRGEIAIRVSRACRDLGWESIALYAEGDEDALHLGYADRSYRIESDAPVPYLDQQAIIAIAQRSEANYIHPGYGFLAENPSFARACSDAGLIFVGPTPDAIATMGDKVAARSAAVAAGLPILPGTIEPLADAVAARAWADQNGYPVALKAAAGGGGRGFRIARSSDELESAFTSAQSESERAFGDGRLYAERYLDRPRHVEIQIFADSHGTAVALGDRDCSIQRRHQKLVEECPAPGLSDETRAAMAEAAIRLTRSVGYTGAGTLEFLVEPDQSFWFLEMNTRIQVEHTVTEEVFGVDLVREQLLIASGEPTTLHKATARGHAIQCRINAEDPGRNFSPNPGQVTRFVAAEGPGVRVDAAARSGSTISERYDSMIAKLITLAPDRDMAIARMSRALSETVVEGVASTVELHRNIMRNAAFIDGDLSTAFLTEQPSVIPPATLSDAGSGPDSATWQEQIVEVNGRRFTVRVPQSESRPNGAAAAPRRKDRTKREHVSASGPTLSSPLQGSVLRIVKAPGDNVSIGEAVLVIEAMKMENEITAHRGGIVGEIAVVIGQAVKLGDPLLTIADPSE